MTDRLHISELVSTAREVEPGLWSASKHRLDQSYPETGHTNLASIEDESYWFRHRAGVLLDLMDSHPPRGALFDIGGGNGYIVRALREAGHAAVLVEPGEDGCRIALQRGLAPVLWGTTSELGIAEQTIPSVGLFDVIEHVLDDHGFMSHIFDLTTPGGRLYLMAPAFGVLWSASDETAGHYRRYSAATVREVVSAAGFEVEYLSYLFRVLTIPLFLLRSIPYRIGVKSSANTTEAHRLPHGWIGSWVARTLENEMRRVRAGHVIRWGTSLVLVARKPG